VVEKNNPEFPNGRSFPVGSMIPETITKRDLESSRRYGFNAGDQLKKMLLAIPGKKSRRQSTLKFDDVAESAGKPEGDLALSNLFTGKVAIIGDVRATRPDLSPEEGIDPAVDPVFDLHKYPTGERIAASYALATATQWLLDGRCLLFPAGIWPWVIALAMSAAGAIGVWWAYGRQRRRVIWGVVILAAMAALWMGGIFAAYFWGMWYIEPWVPLSGLVLGAVCASALMWFGRSGGAPAHKGVFA
jgi:hypothetical protein